MDCENLNDCAFFQEYERDDSKKLALAGFIRMYCKGEKQDDCIRKKVSKALGGKEKVPANMMPTGTPMTGSNTSDWAQEVKDLLKKLNVVY